MDNQQTENPLTSIENISIIVLLIIIVLMVVAVIIIVVFLLLLFRSRNSEVVKWKEDVLEGKPDDSANSDENGKKGESKEPQDEFRVIHVETAVDIDLHLDMNRSKEDSETESEEEKENGDDHSDAATIERGLEMDDFTKSVLVSSEDKESTKDEGKLLPDIQSPDHEKTGLIDLLAGISPPSIVVAEIEPVKDTRDETRPATATDGSSGGGDKQDKNKEDTKPSEDKSKTAGTDSDTQTPPSVVATKAEPVVTKEKDVNTEATTAHASAAETSVITTAGEDKQLESQAKNKEDSKPSEDDSSKDK